MASISASNQFVEPTVPVKETDDAPAFTPTTLADGTVLSWYAQYLRVGQQPEEEPGPTAEYGYNPTPGEESEWAGYTLAAAGEEPEPPAEMAYRVDRERFYRGRLDGEVAADRARIMAGWGSDPEWDGPRETDGMSPGFYS